MRSVKHFDQVDVLQVLLSERVERLALGTVPKLTEKTPQPPLPAPPATEGKGPKQQRSTGATTHDGRHEAQAATDGKPELSDKELKENLSEKVEKLSMNAVPESVKETSQTKVPVPLAPEGKESSQSSSAAASSNDARVKEVPIINEKSDIYKDKIEEKEKVQSELPEATPSSISTLSTTKKEEGAGNATAVLETGVPESLETPADTNTPCEDPVAEDDSKVA